MQASLRSHQQYQQYYDCGIAHNCSIINISSSESEPNLLAAGVDQQQFTTKANYQQHTHISTSNRQVLVQHQQHQQDLQQHHAHHDTSSHLSLAQDGVGAGEDQLHLSALCQANAVDTFEPEQSTPQQPDGLATDQTAILCYAQNVAESTNQPTDTHMHAYELQQINHQYGSSDADPQSASVQRSAAIYRESIEQQGALCSTGYQTIYYEPAEFAAATSGGVLSGQSTIEQHATFNAENNISADVQPVPVGEHQYFQFPNEMQVDCNLHQQLDCTQLVASSPIIQMNHVQVIQQNNSLTNYDNLLTIPDVGNQARDSTLPRTYHTLAISDTNNRYETIQNELVDLQPQQLHFQDIVQTNVNHYIQLGADLQQLNHSSADERLTYSVGDESLRSYQVQVSQHSSSYQTLNIDGSTGVSVTHSSGDSHSSAASTSSASSVISEDSSMSTSLTRDEKRAREANIPLNYYDIVNLSIDQFNEQLARFNLTESQLTLIKDIRRRGKNKVAAQSCRKRKMEQIFGLQHEVNHLSDQRRNLNCECEKLMKEHEALAGRYAKICSILQSHLQPSDS